MNADARHTYWSEPGIWSPRLGELPSDPAGLPHALENFVIHHAIARSLGYGVPAAAEPDRNLRTVEKLLAALVDRDSRDVSEQRELSSYLYCTCHDFALLAASTLRENGVPARLRVGFASYFLAGRWEDHWVCEHWTGERWSVLDAQLGPRARDGLRIGFNVSDVPETGWCPAAWIWRGVRSGSIDPGTTGVSFVGISGAWFVAMSVLRDAAALAGIECLPWDYWGPGREICAAHEVTEEQARDIDALAEALDPAPLTKADAEAVLERFPWARPTATVLSFPDGREAEIAIGPPA